VLENQFILRWKFSLEYGSDGQCRQAGIGIGSLAGAAASDHGR
jgi:hypothetical protein